MTEYFEKLDELRGEREQIERERKQLLTASERADLERRSIKNELLRRSVIRMINEAQKIEAVN